MYYFQQLRKGNSSVELFLNTIYANLGVSTEN